MPSKNFYNYFSLCFQQIYFSKNLPPVFWHVPIPSGSILITFNNKEIFVDRLNFVVVRSDLYFRGLTENNLEI